MNAARARAAREVVAALACAAAACAYADEKPLWELGAGAALVSFPDYRGSDRQHNYLLPVPYFVYRGEVLQIDREKIRGLIFKSDGVELDVSMNGSVPIRSSDNPARQGMPDLDPTLEVGPSLNVRLAEEPGSYRLTFKLPVRAVIASDFHTVHSAGALAHPQLNLDVAGPQGWKIGMVAGPLFADRRYHDYFYGVAPQFATAARPAYAAKGGYSGMQLIGAASQRFGRLWIGGFVKFDAIAGAAFDDSPLVKRRTNLAAGLGATWIFMQSGRRVEAQD